LQYNNIDYIIIKNLTKWNISVVRGKKNNIDFVSTGEGKWRSEKIKYIGGIEKILSELKNLSKWN